MWFQPKTKSRAIGFSAFVVRGERSFGYIKTAASLVVAIYTGAIAVMPDSFIPWYFKLGLIILGGIAIYRWCLFSGRFRNYAVGFFSRVHEHREKH